MALIGRRAANGQEIFPILRETQGITPSRVGRRRRRDWFQTWIHEFASHHAIGDIPQFDGMVAAAGRYGFVVGAEGYGEDPFAVTLLEVFLLVRFELLDQRSVGGVPQLHAAVIAARNDLFAVVVPGQGVYGRRLRSRHGDLMGLDLFNYLPLGDVPNAHRSIVAARRKP